MNKDYRKDVDGLRAIAIVSVVINHIFPNFLTGGFAGVDIFFVISGYLITTHLMADLKDEVFSITKFYSKRIKRIFPALLLVLFTVYIYGFAYVLANQFQEIGKHIAGGAAFVSNFVLMKEAGYFDVQAESKTLLHLWSLSVEEQFYIVWPIVLFVAFKIKSQISSTFILLLISFASCIMLTSNDPVAAFYSPATRAWELLMGASIPLLEVSVNKWKLSQNLTSVINSIALALIGYAIVVFDKSYLYPGYWAVIPVTGALLLIGVRSCISEWLLSNKIMVFLGLISYPLYLWHWPIITIFKNEVGRQITAIEGVGVILISIAMAWLTWRFVEQPVRFRNSIQVKYLLLLMLIVGFLGFNVYSREGITTRHRYLLGGVSQYSYDKEKDQRRHTCFLMNDSEKPTHFLGQCTDVTSGTYKVVLWGDSHAAALYPGLKNLELQAGIGLSQFNIAGCGGELAEGTRAGCDIGNSAALQQIEKIKPDLVIIHKKWSPKKIEKFRKVVTQLRSQGLQVLIVGPTPRWNPDLPGQVVRYWRANNSLPSQYWPEGLDNNEVNFNEDEKLRIESNKLGAHYYSAYSYLCKTEKGCLILIPNTENALTVYDGTHLSTAAAIYLAEDLYKQVLSSLVSNDKRRLKY
jgi:peptidoglycan/LPS O-acetylase OafA/YrhL